MSTFHCMGICFTSCKPVPEIANKQKESIYHNQDSPDPGNLSYLFGLSIIRILRIHHGGSSHYNRFFLIISCTLLSIHKSCFYEPYEKSSFKNRVRKEKAPQPDAEGRGLTGSQLLDLKVIFVKIYYCKIY